MNSSKWSRSGSGRQRKSEGRTERKQYWRDLIMRQCDSDQSIREFCEKQGVHPARFYVWRKKLGLVPQKDKPRKARKQSGGRALQADCGPGDSFIKIKVEAAFDHSGVIVELAENIRIVLSRDFDQGVLRQALQTIRRLDI